MQQQKARLTVLARGDLIERDILKRAKRQLNHDLIKVIIGPRRAGKSVLSLQLLAGKKYGYVDFDDPGFDFDKIDFSELTKSINSVYGKTEYLLFDEIQNLPKWEIYLNSLQKEGYNLVVTGSNAKMLSRDLATVLTGRAIEIQVLPFSYKEALKAKKYLSIDEYMLGGSYPEVLVKKIEPETYYQALFNTSIIKDIVVRYSLRNPVDLENVAKYLLATLTNSYSYRSIADKLNLSAPTVIDYLNYLEETFLFFQLPRFSTKQSDINRSKKKIYCVDFAFARYNTTSLSKNYGFALENAVFVSFLRKGYIPGNTLFYYITSNGSEIDFVAVEKDRSLTLYQVCYSLKDNKTLDREILSIGKAKSELANINKMFLISKDKVLLHIEGVESIDFETFIRRPDLR